VVFILLLYLPFPAADFFRRRGRMRGRTVEADGQQA